MLVLEETISYSPLRGESMELYLDQFGSLLSGPDSVGDVVVKLNPSRGGGLRCVSLLDLDDEGVVVDPILPSPAADAEPAPGSVKDVMKVTSTAVATPSVQPSSALEGIETEGAGAVDAEARRDAGGRL